MPSEARLENFMTWVVKKNIFISGEVLVLAFLSDSSNLWLDILF